MNTQDNYNENSFYSGNYSSLRNIALLTAMRAVWGGQSGGHGLSHLLDV